MANFIGIKQNDVNLAAMIDGLYFSDGVARKVTKGYIGVVPSASGGVELREDLPAEYTQKEYLKASGTQYIDMGMPPTNNTRILIVAEDFPAADGKSLFGSRTRSGSDWFNIIGSVYNGTAYRSDYYKTQQQFTIASSSGRITIDANKNVWTITKEDGTSETVTHAAAEFTSTRNTFLFGINTDGSFAGGSSAKIFSCKRWENDVLVRDYIPCVDSDGTPGMYDAVNGTFSTNAGTGTFEVGNTVRPAGTTGVAMLFYNGETVVVDITGSYFDTNQGYIQIGSTKYTSAAADIQIEAGTEIIIHVGATSSMYNSSAKVTLNGETVLSGQGSYTLIADSDTSISMARTSHRYGWSTYYSYQATITTN